MSNVISTMTVLLAAQRGFKFPDKAWMNHAVQAIGEGIKAIGTYLPMEKKSKVLQVSSRRAILPKDFLDIRGVSYKGQRIPSFSGVGVDGCAEVGQGYSLNPGYVICPFNKGEITLHYVALPVDEKGLPLILNDQTYIDAIRWRIILELIIAGYQHNVINYKEADNKWELYSGRACNAAKMPTRDEMDRFGNAWTRLFNDGDYMEGFGHGLEYSDDTILGGSSMSDYVDRNRLANNS